MRELEASRALDIAVAREVLRIKVHFPQDEGPEWPYYIPSGKPWRTHRTDSRLLPWFSTDPAAAMAILDGWPGDVAIRRQNGMWHVELSRPSDHWDAWAETFPLAVCRAVLQARRSLTPAPPTRPA